MKKELLTSLQLAPGHLPPSMSLPEGIEGLRVNLSGVVAKIEEQAKRMSDQQLLVVVTGHPGTGKSTVVRSLNALGLPPHVLQTFHVDDYIDWTKVVAFVDSQPGLDASHYLPIANEAALAIAKEKLGDCRIIVSDGGGLLRDYAKICKQLGFSEPLFVLVDADPTVFLARLKDRGDGFHVSSKETQERLQNLADADSFRAIKIVTDAMNRNEPTQELKVLLEAVSDALFSRQ